RHAHAPVAWEERQEPLLRARRIRRRVEDLPLRHRWDLEARPGAAGADRALDELLPAARAGLRGADQPRLQPAEPLGLHPDSDVLEVRGGQAHRGPDAGPDV